MEWSLGQLVISKQGRDNQTCYVVTGLTDRCCFVADGRKTSFSAPKKKNKKHLQGTYKVSAAIARDIEEKGALRDEDIRDFLNHCKKPGKEEVPNG